MLKRTSKELFLIADLGSEVNFDNPAKKKITLKQKAQTGFTKQRA